MSSSQLNPALQIDTDDYIYTSCLHMKGVYLKSHPYQKILTSNSTVVKNHASKNWESKVSYIDCSSTWKGQLTPQIENT